MRRHILLATMIASVVALPKPAPCGEPEDNLARLKSMSRADRIRMAKALDAFDALDRPSRDAVRELDDRLAAIAPETRARYLAVMRRYHAFYQGLPREKQAALDRETDSAKKLNLIAAYRAEQQDQSNPSRSLADGLQVSTLSPVRLRFLARHLIVYFSLDPVKDAKELSDFARIKTPAEREAFVRLAKARDGRQELREKLREEDEEFRAAEESVLKNPALARRLAQAQGEGGKGAGLARKPADAKDDDTVAKKKQRDALVKRLDEQQVLRELDPEKVDPSNLDRFETALPPWALETLDALPADAARRRLKALYRLVFPTPQEMPVPKNAKPAPEANRPTAPAPGGANPF